MSEIRYLVNPPEQQYIDHKKATDLMAQSEHYFEQLQELFDEFMADQWGHDELAQIRQLGDVHQGYEDVTEHFLQRRFGTSEFTNWDGSHRLRD